MIACFLHSLDDHPYLARFKAMPSDTFKTVKPRVFLGLWKTIPSDLNVDDRKVDQELYNLNQ